jgi:hypothetical protein
MPRRLVRHACLLLFLGATVLAAGKFPWEDFKKRTLQAAVELDLRAAARVPNPGDRLVLPGGPAVLSKMVVTFSGLGRVIPRERRELLDRWAIARNYAPAYVERYEQEYLFFEGDRRYWLPVQKTVAQQLVRDIKEGAKVELYVLSGVGGLRAGKAWDWLLLVQEYQLPPG